VHAIPAPVGQSFFVRHWTHTPDPGLHNPPEQSALDLQRVTQRPEEKLQACPFGQSLMDWQGPQSPVVELHTCPPEQSALLLQTGIQRLEEGLQTCPVEQSLLDWQGPQSPVEELHPCPPEQSLPVLQAAIQRLVEVLQTWPFVQSLVVLQAPRQILPFWLYVEKGGQPYLVEHIG
jgi:hypothetical protein